MGGGWWVGGWTKTKLMLFSTQVEVVVELKLELSLAIRIFTFTLKCTMCIFVGAFRGCLYVYVSEIISSWSKIGDDTRRHMT